MSAGRISAVLQTRGLLRDLTVGETIELIASTYPAVAGHDPVADVLAVLMADGRVVADGPTDQVRRQASQSLG